MTTQAHRCSGLAENLEWKFPGSFRISESINLTSRNRDPVFVVGSVALSFADFASQTLSSQCAFNLLFPSLFPSGYLSAEARQVPATEAAYLERLPVRCSAVLRLNNRHLLRSWTSSATRDLNSVEMPHSISKKPSFMSSVNRN
jgi:hypothetical protein